MKKYLVLLCLVAGALQAQLSTPILKGNGIYLTAADYLNNKLTAPFNKNEGIKFKENKKQSISIKAPDTTYIFYTDEIWGYRHDGVDWRLFNEEVYRVDYVGKICIYTIPGTPVINIPEWSYFSIDLTSSIHDLSKKNLVAAYHSDTAFVKQINNIPITKSLFKWDKAKGRYQFISWISSQK